MLFNSTTFLQFFAAFLLLYYLCRGRLRARNALIVAASYFFYGWWDGRFLGLIVISTLLDYFVGLGLGRSRGERARRALLACSVAGNLAILGFFKYYDFFAESLAALLASVGVSAHPRTLGIILPVGISFYTFQTMSYTLDVYRGDTKVTRDLVAFAAYVSFFPQLVAGPIERAHRLLPQFERTLVITREMLEQGLWLVIWGLFKKVVVADNLAPLVDMAYADGMTSGPVILLGTAAFALQIYGDFSGYSDIARGTAKMLGFDIMVNFNLPYAARSVRDFWRRWHISLSTWLRDYLYISLGGNRRGAARTYVNLMITMVLGGLWHGASWHFVVWGLWHGAGLVAERLLGREGRSGGGAAGWVVTMLFVLYSWILFRAQSMTQVAAMTRSLANLSLPPWFGSYVLCFALFAAPLAAIQVWQYRRANLLAPLRLPRWGRVVLQGVMLIAVAVYWRRDAAPFIYFQF